MDTVTLPPELERFANEAVAAGRYRDLADVVTAGMSLLQRQERRAPPSWGPSRLPGAEADRDGWVTLDEMTGRWTASSPNWTARREPAWRFYATGAGRSIGVT